MGTPVQKKPMGKIRAGKSIYVEICSGLNPCVKSCYIRLLFGYLNYPSCPSHPQGVKIAPKLSHSNATDLTDLPGQKPLRQGQTCLWSSAALPADTKLLKGRNWGIFKRIARFTRIPFMVDAVTAHGF